MKAFKVLFVMLLLGGFFVSNADAQALVVKNGLWTLDGHPAFHSREVVTPSGTINLIIHLQLPVDNWIIMHAIMLGGKFSYAPIITSDYGEIPGVITVYPDGRVMVNAHYRP